ncbi:hypothetical protein EAG_02159, partial [Camponotus floridanus]
SHRLIVTDKNSNLHFLIDIATDISSLSPKRFVRNTLPLSFKLFAASDTKTNTYGMKTLFLNLGLRRDF